MGNRTSLLKLSGGAFDSDQKVLGSISANFAGILESLHTCDEQYSIFGYRVKKRHLGLK